MQPGQARRIWTAIGQTRIILMQNSRTGCYYPCTSTCHGTMGDRLQANAFQVYVLKRFLKDFNSYTQLSDWIICDLLEVACDNLPDRVNTDPLKAHMYWHMAARLDRRWKVPTICGYSMQSGVSRERLVLASRKRHKVTATSAFRSGTR